MNESQEATYPSLKGRVVFITGGASGIGAATTEKFCEQGATVNFVDIDDASARALISGIGARGLALPRYQHCDLKDVVALKASIDRVIATDGPITVLINNAANDDRHTLDQVTPEYISTTASPSIFATSSSPCRLCTGRWRTRGVARSSILAR